MALKNITHDNILFFRYRQALDQRRLNNEEIEAERKRKVLFEKTVKSLQIDRDAAISKAQSLEQKIDCLKQQF